MKTKYLFPLLACLFLANPAQAQLLKKLKKKAEDAVERTILKKTDEVVAEKTENAIDSIIGKEDNNKYTKKTDKKSEDSATDDEKAQGILDILLSQTPKNPGNSNENTDMSMMGTAIPAPEDNNVKLPDSYNFSFLAMIQVKNNKGTIQTEYLIQPNETYYAKKQTNKSYTEHVVYDNDRNIEVYYAEVQGQKRQARKKMDIFTKAKIVGAYKDAPNREVKPIGEKKLIGFNCKGYEIKTEAGTTQLWVTNDAPATLYGAMFEKRAEAPNSPFTKNTMIMEVYFTSNESADKNYNMLCTQLQPKKMAFNHNDYKE